MVYCQCGHTKGVHFHTNNVASCAGFDCGCKMFKALPTNPESTESLGTKTARLNAWLASRNATSLIGR